MSSEPSYKYADALRLPRVCAHEAAHAAVARHYGGVAYWRVWKLNPDEYDPALDHPWMGTAWTTGYPDTAHVNRRVALAGVVAEALWDNPDLTAQTLAHFIDFELYLPSETDLELAGDYTYRDLSDTVRIVRRLMPRIRAEVDIFLSTCGASYV